MIRKTQNVEIGERYREAGENAFGQAHRRVWLVKRGYTGADGLPYAIIFDPEDGTQKTISENALQTRSLYIPLD